MKFLDTNIILRALARPASAADHAKLAACGELFRRISRGEEQVTTGEAVITEVLYVLCSPRQYNLTHEEAAARLRPLLELRGLQLSGKQLYLRALDLFASSPALDIEDAVIVAHMQHLGVSELLSYDRDFDTVQGITRQGP